MSDYNQVARSTVANVCHHTKHAGLRDSFHVPHHYTPLHVTHATCLIITT